MEISIYRNPFSLDHQQSFASLNGVTGRSKDRCRVGYPFLARHILLGRPPKHPRRTDTYPTSVRPLGFSFQVAETAAGALRNLAAQNANNQAVAFRVACCSRFFLEVFGARKMRGTSEYQALPAAGFLWVFCWGEKMLGGHLGVYSAGHRVQKRGGSASFLVGYCVIPH